VTAVTQMAIAVTDVSRRPVYKPYQHHRETISGGRESTVSSQPFNMTGLTSLGAGGEHLAHDIAELRGTGHQPIPASRYTATLLQLTDAAMSGIAIGQLARRTLNASSRVLRAEVGHVLEIDSGGRVMNVLASRAGSAWQRPQARGCVERSTPCDVRRGRRRRAYRGRRVRIVTCNPT
jgi:hypothetical protein